MAQDHDPPTNMKKANLAYECSSDSARRRDCPNPVTLSPCSVIVRDQDDHVGSAVPTAISRVLLIMHRWAARFG